MTQSQRSASGFKPYPSRKGIAAIQVINQPLNATRSYRTIGGYTPKIYATKPKTPAYYKFQQNKAERINLEI